MDPIVMSMPISLTKNVLKIMVTYFALGDQRKSSDLVIDL